MRRNKPHIYMRDGLWKVRTKKLSWLIRIFSSTKSDDAAIRWAREANSKIFYRKAWDCLNGGAFIPLGGVK